MYERRGQKLLSRRDFAIRVARHGGLVVLAVLLALGLGVSGYHYLAHLAWIDSLLDASMILSGMGPVNPIDTRTGKFFASAYALFSGLFFIAVTGVLLAPFLHRLVHAFHLGQEDRP